MAILRIKSGGAWRLIVSGDFRVKSGGCLGLPGLVYVKGGDAWRDTGYRGYPAVPTGFAVNAWDYDSVSVKWTPVHRRRPVSNYEIQPSRTGRASVSPRSTTPLHRRSTSPVAKNTKYNIYIRSKTAGGQFSAWVGPLQDRHGRRLTSYTTEHGNPPVVPGGSVNGYKDANVGPVVPPTWTCSPFATRSRQRRVHLGPQSLQQPGDLPRAKSVPSRSSSTGEPQSIRRSTWPTTAQRRRSPGWMPRHRLGHWSRHPRRQGGRHDHGQRLRDVLIPAAPLSSRHSEPVL